jgi:hypothetical protein
LKIALLFLALFLILFTHGLPNYSQQTLYEKAETWKDDVGGFIQMSPKFNSSWPTHQPDGSIKQEEHIMDFFFRAVD